jgi:hypothetical protein
VPNREAQAEIDLAPAGSPPLAGVRAGLAVGSRSDGLDPICPGL